MCGFAGVEGSGLIDRVEDQGEEKGSNLTFLHCILGEPAIPGAGADMDSAYTDDR